MFFTLIIHTYLWTSKSFAHPEFYQKTPDFEYYTVHGRLRTESLLDLETALREL